MPVNTSGGLKSFGHPIGASGVRMIYEVVTQLRGEAGARQVKDAKLGLVHNLGGPGAWPAFWCWGRLDPAIPEISASFSSRLAIR